MKISSRDDALDVRSIMFVPALAEAYIEKAHLRGADAIIIDLEDSIPPDLKSKAREALPKAIETISKHLSVFVRVNNTPEHLEKDVEASVGNGTTGILLPKAESAAQIRSIAATLARLAKASNLNYTIALALLVETPLGVHSVADLATADPSVISLVFGSEDYSAILGVRPTPEAMTVPAQLLAIAARAHGLAAWGVAGTIVEISDSDLLTKVARDSKQLGFTGSIAINPRQIPIFNAAFGVSDDEVSWATEVLEVFDRAVKGGRAAVGHKGKMIDTPVAVRAQRILARARRAGTALNGTKGNHDE